MGYGNRTCLDAPGGKRNLKKPAGLYPCHGQGGNQVIITFFSQIASCRLDSLQNPLLYQRWMANRDIFTYLLPTSKNAIKLIFLLFLLEIIFRENF